MWNNYSVQVDVEVYLCYCTGDECNKEDIIAGGGRVGGGFVTPFMGVVMWVVINALTLD